MWQCPVATIASRSYMYIWKQSLSSDVTTIIVVELVNKDNLAKLKNCSAKLNDTNVPKAFPLILCHPLYLHIKNSMTYSLRVQCDKKSNCSPIN